MLGIRTRGATLCPDHRRQTLQNANSEKIYRRLGAGTTNRQFSLLKELHGFLNTVRA